jgi:uncharacterized membrane protein YedE/YeeE
MQKHLQQPDHFWNPYVAGVLLGLALLAAFLVMGWGLGASGATNRLAILAVHTVAPEAVEANAYFRPYVTAEHSVLDDWLVFETLGVFLGGLLGAFSAGRTHLAVRRGARVSVRGRLFWALVGGIIMGFAARLARGCTSGQALSGGALLASGSWAFMMMVFVGGYAVAPLIRRQWR